MKKYFVPICCRYTMGCRCCSQVENKNLNFEIEVKNTSIISDFGSQSCVWAQQVKVCRAVVIGGLFNLLN